MKYLDETGLGKLIELIKAKDTELTGNIDKLDNKATQAQNEATAAKLKAESVESTVSAITGITATEVENAWNG